MSGQLMAIEEFLLLALIAIVGIRLILHFTTPLVLSTVAIGIMLVVFVPPSLWSNVVKRLDPVLTPLGTVISLFIAVAIIMRGIHR